MMINSSFVAAFACRWPAHSAVSCVVKLMALNCGGRQVQFSSSSSSTAFFRKSGFVSCVCGIALRTRHNTLRSFNAAHHPAPRLMLLVPPALSGHQLLPQQLSAAHQPVLRNNECRCLKMTHLINCKTGQCWNRTPLLLDFINSITAAS